MVFARIRSISILLVFMLMVQAGASWAADRVEVIIEGVTGGARENVQAALALPPGLVRDGRVDRYWLERFRTRIPDRVQGALEPLGYYSSEVRSEKKIVGETIQLRVQIELGAPVRITQLHLELKGAGADRSHLREERRNFPLRKGDVLRHDLYEEGKGALKARALDYGYLGADFTQHEIRVHRGKKTAEIDLVLDTGPQYRFGPVEIEGAEMFPDRFLRRYVSFSRGEPFSYAQLGQTQLNFLDSDRFREVIVIPREGQSEDFHVPVTVELEASMPKRLRPGIGYATDTGARFTLHYQNVNAFHQGHELNSELMIAQLKQSVGWKYIVPSRKNAQSHTAFSIRYDKEDFDAYDTTIMAAEVERVRSFSGGRSGAIFLRLLHEDYTIGEDSGTSRLILPGVRFSRHRYRDVIRPEEGYSFSLETRGTHQALGSDTGLLQFVGSGNLLVPLPARFSVFIRAQVGATLQNEPLSQIPPSLRFFAGGDQSVRGYAYQSLGPEDENGDVLGGKNLLVGSVELEKRLTENWGVATFLDGGNAFNDFGDYELKFGAGLGARWYTPVGPIRLDVARQVWVSSPSYRLHISIGFGW